MRRPRLLRALIDRWEHRVTVIVGGPGLGKTTLIAQVLAENRLEPRGDDVWVGVEPQDDDGNALGVAVATALAGAAPTNGEILDADALTSGAVAEAMWQRSPKHVCVVFDDAHRLRSGGAGAQWLADLIEALPSNGHVLLTSRTEPALGLARLASRGELLRLGESELRLSRDELGDFAARRRTDVTRLDVSGGWPAIAELAASTDRPQTGAYLWEEVLQPLGDARRRLLAIVSDLGGADDPLATAVTREPVDLAQELAGIPLIAHGSDGWYVPHDLWRTAPGIELGPRERARFRKRAVRHLLERDRIDQAFTLVKGADLWDTAPEVLRAAGLHSERINPSQLEQCLSASPAEVRTSPGGRLAYALRLAFTQPAAAIEPLREAAHACRDAGDIEAELTALAQLGRLAWGRQDRSSIGGEVVLRITEIERTGNPTAAGLAAFIRALIADLVGRDDDVLKELDVIGPDVLDPVWQAMATWLRGGVLIDRGEPEHVVALADAPPPAPDPAITAILSGLHIRAKLAVGRVDEAVAAIPEALAALRLAGVASIHAQGLVNASVAMSSIGDIAGAEECLAEAADIHSEPLGVMSPRNALAIASLQLARGNEPAAAATLQSVIQPHGEPQLGADRRAWRHFLSLSYILVPEARITWDITQLRGHLARARELAGAIVAARKGADADRLWRLDLSDVGRVRAMLHHRHAAELAVRLAAIGRSEGAALLESLGPAGRTVIQELAASKDPLAKPAKALLGTLPAPPPLVTHISVLGPLALARDQGTSGRIHEVSDADLRRARVRSLIAFLVAHRRTQRAAIMAALWPDLDDQAASNNLGVTLNYLLRALEPWRKAGEPPYLVRLEGQAVELMTGPYLKVDVDEFDEHVTAAGRAQSDGSPSAALEHGLAATALYRGDLGADVADADWLDIERAHFRARFLATATRTAQLLLGRGDADEAESVAKRILAADTWNEDAYGVLASAALLRGDRSVARQRLAQCHAALAELGATPSDATLQLARRAGLTALPTAGVS